MDTASSDQPGFRPFNPSGPLTVYVRNLPHWRQPGATYFVTFRQDDSIPARVLAEWLESRERFFHAHGLNVSLKTSDSERFSEGYRRIPIGIRSAFEREQAKMLHEELDRCHGSCLLRHVEVRRIVIESLTHFQGHRLWLSDWVVMPNHVHALLVVIDNSELEDLLGSIKKWTSRRISEWLAQQPPTEQPARPLHQKSRLWQYESYDRIVRDVDELTAFRRYIARNPEAAKTSSEAFEYAAAPWLDRFAERPVFSRP